MREYEVHYLIEFGVNLKEPKFKSGIFKQKQ